jgi:hypothetical protein
MGENIQLQPSALGRYGQFMLFLVITHYEKVMCDIPLLELSTDVAVVHC